MHCNITYLCESVLRTQPWIIFGCYILYKSYKWKKTVLINTGKSNLIQSHLWVVLSLHRNFNSKLFWEIAQFPCCKKSKCSKTEKVPKDCNSYTLKYIVCAYTQHPIDNRQVKYSITSTFYQVIIVFYQM